MFEPTALIIGAGISGPALALFLQDAGYAVTVTEARTPESPDARWYFNLGPGGRTVLGLLGVLPEVDRIGVPTDRIVFLDHRGHELGHNPAASTLIRRDLLSALLRETAARAGIRFRYGSRLLGVDPCPGPATPRARPVAHFADGTSTEADLVVGCDGIHSAVRQSLLPGGPRPRFTEVIDGGGTARPAEPLPYDGIMRLTFGRRAFFGYQTLPDGTVAWFQNTRTPCPGTRQEPGGIPLARWRHHLLQLHGEDHSPIPGIITAASGPLHRWPVHELPSLPVWSHGPVGVIGDAAHAMAPHDGQGASMALEDALVLAECLRGGEDPARALHRFQVLRRERVETIARQSTRTGRQKFPATERARQVRDQLLPHLLAQGVQSAMRADSFVRAGGERR
ncbi:FAD-dependent oxidoreductase [Streptomyces sp. NPDC091272]|uniref:FAD-dependent oxidoreductase n=1 Tax=Streptomyces sp. NPDC091272 TaxID=3365981 RepID=UPI00381E34C7